MTARDAAREVSDEGPVPWRDLQAAAFSGHPTVLAALDPRSGTTGVAGRLRNGAALAGILLILALIVAPVFAFAIVVVDIFGRPPTPESSIPTASIIFLCTVPLLVGVFLAWYRSDRSRDSLRELQVSLLAAFGILTLGVALVRSALQDYPDGVRWSAGIAVPALFAGCFWIALLREAWRRQQSSGRGGSDPTRDAVPPLEPLGHVRLAVERLSDTDRAAVRADLDAAVADLERRGVIDPATADRARGAELGKLPMAMSQGSSPR